MPTVTGNHLPRMSKIPGRFLFGIRYNLCGILYCDAIAREKR